MKFTIDWLKEHLETTATVEQIVSMLTKLGLPCEKIYKAHAAWNEVEIVRIISKEAHPNADKLNLYEIELANGETKNGQTKKLVCGDQTLEVGMFVPYARDGVVAPSSGITLKIAKIRGIESPGMLCSANDLCLPIEKKMEKKIEGKIAGNGVLQCHQDSFGQTISQAFESTAIIEIEVTPNRGDVLSIRGIARALSHHNIGTLKPLILSAQHYQPTSELASIESSDCAALAVAIIEHAAAKTNALISARLLLTGHSVTGIDIIDLTNYVAHELGQPMHAFDQTKLNGQLKITNLAQSVEYETLAGQKITLDKNTLVIQDNSKTVSWPGVIGGNNSKIEASSNKILLETGVFKIDSIARRKHKIQTSAAKKFECGVDVENLENAINRYCYLLGTNATKAESHKFTQKKIILFNISYIKKILGIDITLEQLMNRLEPRGFVINTAVHHTNTTEGLIHHTNTTEEFVKDNLEITVPSYKFFDVHSPNCIVEEYATGYYEEIESINLPPRMPKTTKQEPDTLKKLAISATECGFNQTYNFTLTNAENLAFSDIKTDGIKIKNSTNNNYATLRVSIIPQLLKTCAWHSNNCYHDHQFFETGLIYGDFNQQEQGCTQQEIFTAIALEPDALLKIFYHFLESINLITPLSVQSAARKWQESGSAFSQNNHTIAAIGRIKHDLVKAAIDSKENYYALEIYIPNLQYLEKKQYSKPAAQSPIYKDISFMLPENTPINRITDLLENHSKKHQYSFVIFDIYPSNNISTKRNLGVRFQFNLDDAITKNDLNEKIESIKILALQELNIKSN